MSDALDDLGPKLFSSFVFINVHLYIHNSVHIHINIHASMHT